MPVIPAVLEPLLTSLAANGLADSLQPHGGSPQQPVDPSDILNGDGGGGSP